MSDQEVEQQENNLNDEQSRSSDETKRITTKG